MTLTFVYILAEHETSVELGLKTLFTVAFKRAGCVHADLNAWIAIVQRTMTFVYILDEEGDV